ncbi:hypothetical protein LCGC14_2623110 [marine sediment metagenome]|uniref:Uncharacterized protein n=1 Tax=marine sediment metagenome TaxID=412755 RepID=A0A0F9CDK3_9ZZZZ
MNRQEQLIKAAAVAFDNGCSPFVHEWLLEHEVTADECMELSSVIGTILQGYLVSPKEVKLSLGFRGAVAAAGMPSEVIEAAVASLEMKAVLKRLKEARA